MKSECGMRQDIEEVLFTEEQIAQIVERVGSEISRDYEGKKLLLVSVLKGSVVFMADLMRAVTIPARIDFMATSSYGSGVKTSGVVKIVKDLDLELKDYDIVIVEDILDSGKTLSYLMELLQSPFEAQGSSVPETAVSYFSKAASPREKSSPLPAWNAPSNFL